MAGYPVNIDKSVAPLLSGAMNAAMTQYLTAHKQISEGLNNAAMEQYLAATGHAGDHKNSLTPSSPQDAEIVKGTDARFQYTRQAIAASVSNTEGKAEEAIRSRCEQGLPTLSRGSDGAPQFFIVNGAETKVLDLDLRAVDRLPMKEASITTECEGLASAAVGGNRQPSSLKK